MLAPAGVTFRRDAVGNLIGSWPGRNSDCRPIMLNAHMDTVQPTPGMEPRVTADGVYSDGSSVLGADDKAGVAAIVEAVLAVSETGLDHAPVELVFTVGEDVGLIGSTAFDLAEIESRVGFVLDAGGPVGTVITHAPGHRRYRARFHGKASHAGIAPEHGVSAIKMLSEAVSRLPQGLLEPGTTANVGVVSGGQAMNIVAPEATVEGEARSLREARLDEVMSGIQEAIEDAAARGGGTAAYEAHTFYRAYELRDDDPAVALADAAIAAAGLAPVHAATGGGSDAHQFIAKGMSAACLSAGYVDVHSVNEYMPHAALSQLTEVTAQLIVRA